MLVSTESSKASIATGAPVFGNTELVLSSTASQTTTLNLSGSGASTSPSIPCKDLQLAVVTSGGATGVLMGQSSATCTYPVYATPTSGTLGVQYFKCDQATNLNQLWFSLTNSGSSGTYTAKIEAVYLQ